MPDRSRDEGLVRCERGDRERCRPIPLGDEILTVGPMISRIESVNFRGVQVGQGMPQGCVTALRLARWQDAPADLHIDLYVGEVVFPRVVALAADEQVVRGVDDRRRLSVRRPAPNGRIAWEAGAGWQQGGRGA